MFCACAVFRILHFNQSLGVCNSPEQFFQASVSSAWLCWPVGPGCRGFSCAPQDVKKRPGPFPVRSPHAQWWQLKTSPYVPLVSRGLWGGQNQSQLRNASSVFLKSGFRCMAKVSRSCRDFPCPLGLCRCRHPPRESELTHLPCIIITQSPWFSFRLSLGGCTSCGFGQIWNVISPWCLHTAPPTGLADHLRHPSSLTQQSAPTITLFKETAPNPQPWGASKGICYLFSFPWAAARISVKPCLNFSSGLLSISID